MRKRISFTLLLAALGTAAPGRAQEVVNPNCNLSKETSLVDLTHKAQVVVEGQVEGSRSFWSANHSGIYTAISVTVYKVFKGNLQGDRVEIVIPGGAVGEQWEMHDDDPAVLPLSTGMVGIFFGVPTAQGTAGTALPPAQVLDVVGEYEGFFCYSGVEPDPSAAFSACRRYRNVPVTLYEPIQQATGQRYQTLHAFDVSGYVRSYIQAPTAVPRPGTPAPPALKKRHRKPAKPTWRQRPTSH